MTSSTPAPENVKADPKRPYKAYAGALVTLVGLLWAALEGRTDNLGNMTLGEWLSVVVPVLINFAAVYGVENPNVVERP